MYPKSQPIFVNGIRLPYLCLWFHQSRGRVFLHQLYRILGLFTLRSGTMHWWQPTNSSMNHWTPESLMDRLSSFTLMQMSAGCHKKGWWLQSWSPWSPNSEISNMCCRLSSMKSEIYMDIVYRCITYMPWNLSCQMYIEPTKYLASWQTMQFIMLDVHWTH